MLKKEIAKQHYDNVRLNISDNASLVVYQVALPGHWLVMGLKIDSSPIDVWLSKMEAAIENIVPLTAVGNLVVNQLMEREATTIITTKPTSMEEPKWTTMMAKNVH
jgi:hypothetical protein